MYYTIDKRRYPVENNTQLLKGVLEFCVLKFISREPTYGYEIVIHLKQVGFSDLSESTLYPVIHIHSVSSVERYWMKIRLAAEAEW